MGQIDEVRARLKENPDSILDHFALGKLLLDQGNVGEAIEAFQTLVKLKDDYLMAHVHLAELLVRENRPEEALPVLRRARQLAIDQKHKGPQEDVEAMLEDLGESP